MKLILVGFGGMLGYVFTKTEYSQTAIPIFLVMVGGAFLCGWRFRSDKSVATAVASAVAKAEAEARAQATAEARAEFQLHLHGANGLPSPSGPASLVSERSEDTGLPPGAGEAGALISRQALMDRLERGEVIEQQAMGRGPKVDG